MIIDQDPLEISELLLIFKGLWPRLSVVEIGSREGGTLKLWLDNMEKARCVSIDLSEGRPEQVAGHGGLWLEWAKAKGNRFACLEKESQDRNIVDIVEMAMAPIDFLFIDGGHTYEQVKADYDNYGSLVRYGGIIAFHDVVDKDWPDVVRFWNEVSQGKNSRLISHCRDKFGIGVIYK